MAKYLVEDSTLTAIADSIRAKSGTTDPISLTDIPIIIEEELGSNMEGSIIQDENGNYIVESYPIYMQDTNGKTISMNFLPTISEETTIISDEKITIPAGSYSFNNCRKLNGYYYICSYSKPYLIRTQDFKTFYNCGLEQPCSCIAYGNGKFVALCGGLWDEVNERWSEGIAYSTNGTSWTYKDTAANPYNFNPRSLEYIGNYFVTNSYSTIYYSTNGQSWSQGTYISEAGSSSDHTVRNFNGKILFLPNAQSQSYYDDVKPYLLSSPTSTPSKLTNYPAPTGTSSWDKVRGTFITSNQIILYEMNGSPLWFSNSTGTTFTKSTILYDAMAAENSYAFLENIVYDSSNLYFYLQDGRVYKTAIPLSSTSVLQKVESNTRANSSGLSNDWLNYSITNSYQTSGASCEVGSNGLVIFTPTESLQLNSGISNMAYYKNYYYRFGFINEPLFRTTNGNSFEHIDNIVPYYNLKFKKIINDTLYIDAGNKQVGSSGGTYSQLMYTKDGNSWNLIKLLDENAGLYGEIFDFINYKNNFYSVVPNYIIKSDINNPSNIISRKKVSEVISSGWSSYSKTAFAIYNDELYVLNYGKKAMKTSDGENWTEVVLEFKGNVTPSNIYYFYKIKDSYYIKDSSNNIFRSNNLVNWNFIGKSSVSFYGEPVNDYFITSNGKYIYLSSDLINWYSLECDENIVAVTYNVDEGKIAYFNESGAIKTKELLLDSMKLVTTVV